AYEREESAAAKDAIAQILTNSRMCAEGHRPICQDTGIVVVFVNNRVRRTRFCLMPPRGGHTQRPFREGHLIVAPWLQLNLLLIVLLLLQVVLRMPGDMRSFLEPAHACLLLSVVGTTPQRYPHGRAL